MSSTEDDEFIVKIDSNVEVETVLRNRFEEYEDMYLNDIFNTNYLVSSACSEEDEDQGETSGESSHDETGDRDTTASVASDASETYTSAVSDVSAESTDSMNVDPPNNSNEGKKDHQQVSSTSRNFVNFLESRLRYVNCKELIVFCIDMSSDMENEPFIITDEFDDSRIKTYSKAGKSLKPGELLQRPIREYRHTALSMVKRAISMFVHHKHSLDKKHEYALMVLYETATWVSEFTNSPQQLIDALEDLTETIDVNSCDLSSVVQLLTDKYPFVLSNDFLPPDMHRILRVILIYSRANCNVKFSDPKSHEILLDKPSLFFDVIYIHECDSKDNKVREIFQTFCNMDERDKFYIFELSQSVTSLHNAMGLLLCHPYQRALQKDTNYKLSEIVPPV